MKIRFQADADLNENIIAGLQRREPGIDFQSAADAGLRGLSDFEVLAVAAQEGRVLVSHDFRTMPTAFARFLEESRRQAMQQTTGESGGVGRLGGSPGLLIAPQKMPIRVVIDSLLMIWAASEAVEWSADFRSEQFLTSLATHRCGLN